MPVRDADDVANVGSEITGIGLAELILMLHYRHLNCSYVGQSQQRLALCLASMY